jgi:hypothetical protein
VLAIWRHVEMYINADPDAITPSGDLLTSSYHAGQHAEHREEHSKLGLGVGGYVAFIAQRYGCSPRLRGHPRLRGTAARGRVRAGRSTS